MARDKVMSPPKNAERAGGIKDVKMGAVEGPVHQSGRYTPFAHNQKPGK